jgi:hypothetical protein
MPHSIGCSPRCGSCCRFLISAAASRARSMSRDSARASYVAVDLPREGEATVHQLPHRRGCRRRSESRRSASAEPGLNSTSAVGASRSSLNVGSMLCRGIPRPGRMEFPNSGQVFSPNGPRPAKDAVRGPGSVSEPALSGSSRRSRLVEESEDVRFDLVPTRRPAGFLDEAMPSLNARTPCRSASKMEFSRRWVQQ